MRLLIFLTVIGGFLRFYNLNWDEFHTFHPDERNIAAAVTRIKFFENLNPEFFAYGGFFIYLIRAVGEIIVAVTQNSQWVTNWGHINLISRAISALVGTLAIPLTFLLAKQITNTQVSLLAATLVAFTPSLIQASHFGTTEGLLVLWALVISIISLKISQEEHPTSRLYVLAGFLSGAAVATKTSTLIFLVPFAAAHIAASRSKTPSGLQKKFVGSLLVALTVFALLSPHSFLSWNKFLESMSYESGVVLGKFKVVYVLQFETTLPYLYHFKNLLWQTGIQAIFALLGSILLTVEAVKNKDRKLFVFVCLPLVYFAYVGSWYAKFIRYLVPILPFFSIFAAYFLYKLSRSQRFLGFLLTTVVVSATIFWGLAFWSIYTKPQTRIVASQWIYKNIPHGARILGEHWDDGLPVSLGEKHTDLYRTEQLTIYEPDTNLKTQYYSGKLAEADYIIINSRRLYGTLIRLDKQYPITSRYYRLLFAGRLGYTKVAEFASYPKFLGITINDDSAEETFQVYDHPKVLIFKNTERFQKERLFEILTNG